MENVQDVFSGYGVYMRVKLVGPRVRLITEVAKKVARRCLKTDSGGTEVISKGQGKSLHKLTCMGGLDAALHLYIR